eukprot:SAG11_NODE_2901_length_2849_cov_4.048727_4_plen_43_part_01
MITVSKSRQREKRKHTEYIQYMVRSGNIQCTVQSKLRSLTAPR